jgi:hypothetical protein
MGILSRLWHGMRSSLSENATNTGKFIWGYGRVKEEDVFTNISKPVSPTTQKPSPPKPSSPKFHWGFGYFSTNNDETPTPKP